ncbi:hypothetical protein ONZ51_g6945 [Trametes cubensis]|uniref:Protein kinase domain-containing protein n=1 Tax=Trametes cubensis TaxID=1111947 RepID=A0AAD7TR38_9APHY|nr:hypothetical protein ONZ51_g6945 [Trametes cubensis]
MTSGNPPWYEIDENGQIMVLEVPSRLKSHPEVIRRGLEPTDPWKVGVVYSTSMLKEPLYYIKILDTDTEEAAIFQQLSRQVDTRNHTIPGELTPPETGHPLLITPAMSDFSALLIEGIEYMHDLRITHMDICPGNVLVADPQIDRRYSGVEPGKVYLIDFGSSLQLPLGPGSQHAITLPPSQFRPENGITCFDPYSWDVYCAALTMQQTLKTCYRNDPPRIACLYADWLKGKERGCKAVCHCRPTARRARQVLTGVLWLVRAWEQVKNVLYILKSSLSPPS